LTENSTLSTLIKASEIVASAGIRLEVALPIASAAYQVYREADALGLAEEDISGVIKLFEKFAKL
jgi:3-hydroxyisobutyrate dehydrogenase-like beta-hydroxyacid dehydrogenase